MAASLISKCKCEGMCWDLNMGRCKAWTLDWTIGLDDWTGLWTGQLVRMIGLDSGLDDWTGRLDGSQ